MARDPWKRAYELTQSPPPPAPPPYREPRGRGWLWFLALVLLGGLATAAWMLGYLKPPGSETVTEALPEPVERVLPKREGDVVVDVTALDDGLGIELRLYGDYLDVIAATQEWKIPWEIKTTGGGTLRVTAPGITMFTRQGLVQTYELDLQELEDATVEGGALLWAAWLPQLRRAGLDRALDQEQFSGLQPAAGESNTFYLAGERDITVGRGTVKPQYLLRFRQNELAIVKGGQSYSGDGTGTVGKPETQAAPAVPAG
jgi:hypothetical protein